MANDGLRRGAGEPGSLPTGVKEALAMFAQSATYISCTMFIGIILYDSIPHKIMWYDIIL
jgi:hypothetical protein